MIFLTNPPGDMAREHYKRGPKKGQFKPGKKRRKPNPSPKPKAARRKATPNPHRRKTVARKMPPRHKSGPKKGQFKKSGSGGGTRRRTSSRRAPARRSYSRNPPRRRRMGMGNIVQDLTDGAIGAAQVLTGKAAARVIPQQFNLSLDGPMGLATQLGVAIVVGKLAENFVSKKAAQLILIGGLTAPVESAIVAANVPFLSPALAAYPALRAYPQNLLSDGNVLGLSAYPQGIESYDVQGYGAGGY